MNNEEATEILEIMTTADHGCSSCVKRLFTKFIYKFPSKREIAESIWDEDYDRVDWDKEIRLEEPEC